MIDARINKIFKPILNVFAKKLLKLNVSPNLLTFIGFFFGICCFYFVVNQMFIYGAIFLLINRIFDGLDGALARLIGETDLGAFYDIVLDFLFYSLFPISFILIDLENSYSICFLLLSFVATQTTFLASAWLVEKNKLLISDGQKKSFFYTGGITEGFETILCFMLMLFFNEYVNYIAYIFGFLCWITFVTRIFFIKSLLKP
tara:strand:+ start:251 stop:856 length:606 start_codon:yes stop_codon:yes gene_type:complete